jgi:hypothetical protein
VSINALTKAAAARRPNFAPFGVVPQGISGIAAAAARIPVPEGMRLPEQPIRGSGSLQAESMPVPEEVPLPQQPSPRPVHSKPRAPMRLTPQCISCSVLNL